MDYGEERHAMRASEMLPHRTLNGPSKSLYIPNVFLCCLPSQRLRERWHFRAVLPSSLRLKLTLQFNLII